MWASGLKFIQGNNYSAQGGIPVIRPAELSKGASLVLAGNKNVCKELLPENIRCKSTGVIEEGKAYGPHLSPGLHLMR